MHASGRRVGRVAAALSLCKHLCIFMHCNVDVILCVHVVMYHSCIWPSMWSLSYALLCIRCVMQRLTHTRSCKFMRTSTYASMPLCCLMQCAMSYAMLCYVYESLSLCVLMCGSACHALLCSWALMRYLLYACHAVFMYTLGVLAAIRSYVSSFLCKFMQPRSYADTTLCMLCSHYVYPMRLLCHATSCELWPLQ